VVPKFPSILPLNDYFTKLSLLVSSSHWRGRGKEREFTSLPGNRQFKIVIKRIKDKINPLKVKAVLQFN